MAKAKKENIFQKISKHRKIDEVVRFIKTDIHFKQALILLVAISIFTNLNLIKLGPVTVSEDSYITVTGIYSSVESNQIATFIATIQSENSEKTIAKNAVTEDARNLSTLIVEFGIDPQDIKTTSNTVYQVDADTPSTSYRGDRGEKVWRASNSTEIKLRDIEKVHEFSELLTGLARVELYGPNYNLEQEDIDDASLLAKAISNAYKKAEAIAKAEGNSLGKIINIEELGQATIMPYGTVVGYDRAFDTSEFNPGSTKVTKSVLVKYELR